VVDREAEMEATIKEERVVNRLIRRKRLWWCWFVGWKRGGKRGI